MPRKRKAVGEIMAALILMMIVSIAGVILFTTSLRTSNAQGEILRSQINDDGESAQERFTNLHTSIKKTVNDDFTYDFTIWVHNYGKIDCILMDIYLKDPEGTNNIIKYNIPEEQREINTNEIKKITFSITTSSGYSAFEINIISERGVSHVSKWII